MGSVAYPTTLDSEAETMKQARGDYAVVAASCLPTVRRASERPMGYGC
jgi:hypothetical protein